MTQTLDERLLAAHRRDDRRALVSLYRAAADAADKVVARGFYLTHAYVFALDTGHPDAATLHAILKDMGRES